MDSVLKETLRLVPPFGSLYNRLSVKDHQIGSINIRKNTLVSVYPSVLHTNESHYQNSREFTPERWSDKKNPSETDKKTFLPFFLGPRACPAERLSILICKTILMLFLKRFKFSIAQKDIKMTYKFMYEPLESIFCKLEER